MAPQQLPWPLLPSLFQAQHVNLTPRYILSVRCLAMLFLEAIRFFQWAISILYTLLTDLILKLIACSPGFWGVCPAPHTLDKITLISFADIFISGLLFKWFTWPITESRGDRGAGSFEGLSSCSQVDPGTTGPSSWLVDPKPPHPSVFFKSAEPPVASFSAHMEFSMCLLDLYGRQIESIKGQIKTTKGLQNWAGSHPLTCNERQTPGWFDEQSCSLCSWWNHSHLSSPHFLLPEEHWKQSSMLHENTKKQHNGNVFRQLTTGFVTVFSSDFSGRPSLELFSCWSNSWVCSHT